MSEARDEIAPAERLPPAAPPGVRELVEAFLSGRKATTLDAYRRDLEAFGRFAGTPAKADAAVRVLIEAGHAGANLLAHRWRAAMVADEVAPATINRRLSALRSLVKLARTLALVVWQLDVPAVKAEAYRDTKGPGQKRFRALVTAARDRADAKGARDVAILRLLHDLGLRRAEVTDLDLEHLDLERGVLAVQGKGKSERAALTLPAPTTAALRAWLTVRGTEPGPLFIPLDRHGTRGRVRLCPDGLYRAVRRYGADEGFRVTPHGLRHTAITAALDATGGDVRAVQRFSRHADVRTIGRYDDAREDLGGKVAALVATKADMTPGA